MVSTIYPENSQQLEAASVYQKNDPNYRDKPGKLNEVIERELEKHKLVIEGRFNASLMNQTYIFPRL